MAVKVEAVEVKEDDYPVLMKNERGNIALFLEEDVAVWLKHPEACGYDVDELLATNGHWELFHGSLILSNKSK